MFKVGWGELANPNIGPARACGQVIEEITRRVLVGVRRAHPNLRNFALPG
jgi:hypothetical protein